ncbi:platelet-activating factor acetylhydrolase isoform X2 [Bufo gargarizans]|uniref:platelet-activating factor acetylhydrolase isoform X2 n=1 Tax=Bufo gargarizans TaxID=30331 RepID=UPI001CF5ABAB|nr:platelet-activating factor acetylhydrolase isoform X2 [Bufo gargarizans]XP_044144957.1 platelet-activating factor acetylhydrolase isoform X2 [Bufo gargarizans]XP_044144958.1 platelet-activating factor acetylhydrolase isoform X2 [Bufo gargarizans]
MAHVTRWSQALVSACRILQMAQKSPATHFLTHKVPRTMGSYSSVQFCGMPQGKGPHAVGCTDLMSDHTIQGSFLRLFYPCVDGDEYEEATWIPRREYYRGLADTLKLNRTIVDFILSYYFGSVKCPAKLNAPFKSGEKYPLVVFSHGLGAFRTLYSAFCIGLASQGFVVAAVEHRDESASATFYLREHSSADSSEQDDSREPLEEVWIYNKAPPAGEDEFPLRFEQVQKRTHECLQALDLLLDINAGKPVNNALPSNFNWLLLKDSIDVQKVAVAGHSFGAATAIKALGRDSRFRCGVALDAWMYSLREELFSTVHQPVIFVNSEKFQWVDNILLMKKMNSTSVERKMITIKGSVHQSFPDFTFLTGYLIGKIFKLKGEIDPYVGMDIIINVTLAFLQRHLGIQKDFNQWDPLIDGKGEFVIPGTNLDLPPAHSKASK